jgi:FeS assembly SUF system protein
MTDDPKPDAMSDGAVEVAAAGVADAGVGQANVAEVCAASPSAIPPDEMARLSDEIVQALKTVYDPEIPADIYELGLIYKVDIADDRKVTVDMTLTTPNCPSAAELPTMVENAVASVPGVGEVAVNVVWDPPWDQSRMSDEARVALNMW